MYTNIFESLWMKNDRETRNYLADIFQVPMTGLREIHNEEVIKDGRSNEDLKSITLEKMNDYTGISDDSIMNAWNNVCIKASKRFDVIPMADEPKEEPIVIMVETEAEAIKKAEEIINVIEKTNDKTKKSK